MQIGFDPRDRMVKLNGRDRLVELIDVSIRITGKETLAEIRIFVGGNRLFCNTVHLEHFYTCNSHELQLFDTSVAIKGRADDRSVYFLYVVVS